MSSNAEKHNARIIARDTGVTYGKALRLLRDEVDTVDPWTAARLRVMARWYQERREGTTA